MTFPDSDSAKVIIQSRIKEVVVLKTFDETDKTSSESSDIDKQASRILLDMAGVDVRYFKPSMSSVTLDFVAKMAPSTVAEGIDNVPNASKNASTEEGEEEKRARELLLDEAKYDASKVKDNGKRKDSISWQDYFMAMAFLTAERSKDPNTQVGACIVDSENRIIGLGYNGEFRVSF
jgi:deoxycytidylate deaminase